MLNLPGDYSILSPFCTKQKLRIILILWFIRISFVFKLNFKVIPLTCHSFTNRSGHIIMIAKRSAVIELCKTGHSNPEIMKGLKSNKMFFLGQDVVVLILVAFKID